MTNIGLDVSAFRNKLQFSAEYYIKDQNKLLTYLPLQAVYGLSGDANPPVINLGDLKNTGFEFNATFKKQEGRFNYSISTNLTTVRNSVEYLPQTQQFNTEGINVAKEGHTIGSYWGYVAERILQVSDFETDDNGDLIGFTPPHDEPHQRCQQQNHHNWKGDSDDYPGGFCRLVVFSDRLQYEV